MSRRPVSKTVRIGDDDLYVHHWNAVKDETSTTKAAVVVIFHGFLAHGLYPTVRYAAETLAGAGLQVIAADYPGHGQSPGLRSYLPSTDDVLKIGVAMVQYAKSKGSQVFLVGSSMGGAIALSVAHKMPGEVAGVVMLAPMLKLSVSTVERYLLSMASMIVPTMQLIPSSASSTKDQCRDPAKCKACEEDPLVTKGQKIRVGSAATLVDITDKLRAEFRDINVPFLILLADEDVVVDPQGALDLYEEAGSEDKSLKRYPALHAMLCEPSPLADQIKNDLLEWVRTRASL